MQIYDFNHDDKSDGSGKAGITFGMRDLMANKRVMNSIDTNNYGWDGSDLRAYLNGVTTVFQAMDYSATSVYSQLPIDLKKIIINVDKNSTFGDNYHPGGSKTSSDKLFIFSEQELFGERIFSVSGESYKYPIFSDNNSRIKKMNNGVGSSYGYWSRSTATWGFFTKTANDGSHYYDNSYISNGISFGFAI